jgi:hypothetical protein
VAVKIVFEQTRICQSGKVLQFTGSKLRSGSFSPIPQKPEWKNPHSFLRRLSIPEQVSLAEFSLLKFKKPRKKTIEPRIKVA